jgi:hypothetical protein
MLIKKFVQVLHEKSIILNSKFNDTNTSFHFLSGY